MSQPKKPTAKQVFRNVKPVDSKNVIVYFDRAFRVRMSNNFDGYMRQLDGVRGVFVRHPDHGDDLFVIPYAPALECTSPKAMESSLRGALRTRDLNIVSLDELTATSYST